MTDSGHTTDLKRDALLIALVGAGHFLSHFFQLSLAPLFPLMHETFGVSYALLGSVLTVFYVMSGVAQSFAGILVDRYGARPVLFCGIAMMATGIGLAGVVPQFWMLYPLIAMVGLGNSVFHPADFSLLSHRVSPSRHGRAFSLHAFAGSLGYAAAPLLIGGLAVATNWRIALVGAGLLGIALLGLLMRYSGLLKTEHSGGKAAPLVQITLRQLIGMPVVVFAFGYLFFWAMAGNGFSSTSTVIFMEQYGVSLTSAAMVLSMYLVGGAVGMLCGGVLADKTKHHARVAITGLAGAALAMIVLGTGALSFAWVIVFASLAGFFAGATAPSRDILVKSVAPAGTIGRVFGLVYSGADVGLAASSLLFGALVDRHAYAMIFVCIAFFLTLAIFTVTAVSQRRVQT